MRTSQKIKLLLFFMVFVGFILLTLMLFSAHDGRGKITGIIDRFQRESLDKDHDVDALQSHIMHDHVGILELELKLHSFNSDIEQSIINKGNVIIYNNALIDDEILDFSDHYVFDNVEKEILNKTISDFRQYKNYIDWAIKSIKIDSQKSRDYLLASESYFFRLDNSFKIFKNHVKTKSQQDLLLLDGLVYHDFIVFSNLSILAFILVVLLSLIMLVFIKDRFKYSEKNEDRLEGLVKERTKELMLANQAKTDFLSRMSHELNTPLNIIIGFSQTIKDQLSENQQKMMCHIIRSGQSLMDFVNHVFEYSQIELNKIEVNFQDLPVKYLIEECKAETLKLMESKHLTLIDNSNCLGFDLVHVDKEHFKKVLLILLSNAIKYNVYQGMIQLNYQVVENNKLRILVADTGVGVDSSLVNDLFQPFERLGYSGSPTLGSGLGLVIAKNLAKRMGGDIGYQPAEKQGSIFWMDVTLAKSSLN